MGQKPTSDKLVFLIFIDVKSVCVCANHLGVIVILSDLISRLIMIVCIRCVRTDAFPGVIVISSLNITSHNDCLD